MDTQLILVDGIPGSGKSSLAQSISAGFEEQGVPCRWYHEEHKPHPVHTFFDSSKHRTASDYCDDALARWAYLAQRIRETGDVTVLDAALLQNPIRSLLYHNSDAGEMLAVVRGITDVVSSLEPVLVYLWRADVGATIKRTCARRGEKMLRLWLDNHDLFPYAQQDGRKGYTGLIRFWQELRGLSDRALAEFGGPKLRIDTTDEDWRQYRVQVGQFLVLPLREPAVSDKDLARFAGTYTSDAAKTCEGFEMREGDDCLVARFSNPSMVVSGGPFGCFREVRLLPKELNVFHVAGWPHEAVFEEDSSGSVVRVRLRAPSKGRLPCTEVFTKET